VTGLRALAAGLLAAGACLTAVAAEDGGAPTAASPPGNPLHAERWKTRPLVVVVPAADAPLLTQVRRTLEQPAARAGFIEREMVLYTVVDGKGARDGQLLTPAQTGAMLAALGLPPGAGATLALVGKDGGTKLVERDEAFDLQRIFALVDGMPMRQPR
jgi:hypothetical protein